MLQHGLLDNSATWTINYFNQTLPHLLLQNGYDVWITNTRGNFNSYEHTNPKEYSVYDNHSKYWNFTLDEMAIYDLPANINYILDYTNSQKLTYIGHSQGTIQFFAANCLQDLASKIEAFVGLGPVMYVNHQESPIVTLVVELEIDVLLGFLRFENVLLWPKIVNVELKTIVSKITRTIWRFIQLICGVEEEITVDLNRMPVMGRHEPGGTSFTNMRHWIQMMKTGEFKRMDYGKDQNMLVYGQPTPPFYNITNLQNNLKDLDMYLIKGRDDGLVSQTDFNNLLAHFKPKIGKSLWYDIVDRYGHLDYVWAKDSFELINKPILKFLKDRKH